MPNRKTFDPSEKYDHSGRPVEHAQKNDLQPDVSENVGEVERPGSGAAETSAGRTRNRGGNQGPPA